MSIVTDGNIIKDPSASVTGVSVTTDTTNFNNNLTTSETTVQAALDKIDNLSLGGVAGTNTQLQYNDSAALGGAAELLYTKATGVLTIGHDSTAVAALEIQGSGRASDGRSLVITNAGAAGAVALEINAHAGGTAGYGINMSAIIPINIVTVGENYAITAINHANLANTGGLSVTIGAGDQASNKDFLYLKRQGTGAHTGNYITMLWARGAAGQDNDVLGTISFKGYNDNATPELFEYGKITGSILDASDTTEDGKLAFSVAASGTLQTIIQMYHVSTTGSYFELIPPEGVGKLKVGGSGINTAGALWLDANGGLAEMSFTNANFTSYGFRFNYVPSNNCFQIYDDVGGIGSAIVFKGKGIGFFAEQTDTFVGTTGDKIMAFKNSSTAPTAVAANFVQMWSADYAAGDARFFVMGEGNVNTLGFGAGRILLDSSPADHTASGKSAPAICGEALTLFDPCYRKADGKFYKADADQATTMPAVVLCLATTALTTGGASVSTTESSKTYAGTGLGTGFQVVGDIITFTGFSNSGSNGAKTVATIGSGTITVTEAIGADESGVTVTWTVNNAVAEFLHDGYARDDSWNWTVGGSAGLIYVSDAGALTQTAPTGSGDQVQVVGWAYTADIMYFDPQLVMVEV